MEAVHRQLISRLQDLYTDVKWEKTFYKRVIHSIHIVRSQLEDKITLKEKNNIPIKKKLLGNTPQPWFALKASTNCRWSVVVHWELIKSTGIKLRWNNRRLYTGGSLKDPKRHSNTTPPTVWSTGEAHSGTFKSAETEQLKVEQWRKN